MDRLIQWLLTALRLGVVVVAVDWGLVLIRRERRPFSSPVHARVEIHAPIERTWAVLADIPGQTRWMPEMRSVRMITPDPTEVGSIGEATIRIFGIAVTDRVAITTYRPPTAFGIEHRGLFLGAGLLTLESGADGSTTTVDWVEHLDPPWLPRLGWIFQRPIIARLYQRDLFLLRDVVEGGG